MTPPDRRSLLLGALAGLALPGAAMARRRRRPPRISLILEGQLSHRRQPATQRGVELRFSLLPGPMAKDPIWSHTEQLDVRDGVLKLELRRGLGNVETNDFPDEVWLRVQVLSLGPDVSDLTLGPKLRLPWSTDARPDCFEADESLSVADEGGCLVAGEGAVAITFTELRREPGGGWTPEG